MRKIVFILLFVVSIDAFSQGFDWQYSSRLPFETPKNFIGVYASGNYNINSGDFIFLSGQIPCCNFDLGTGFGYSTGLSFESWIYPDISIFSSIVYTNSHSVFLTESEPHPYRDFDDVVTEYEFSNSTNYFGLELGTKLKLAGSHFFFAPILKFSFLLSKEHTFLERIISEKDFLFEEIPYSYGQVPELSTFVFSPSLKFGYDLDLGLGKYAELFSTVSIPVDDISNEESWKLYRFSLGTNIYLFGF